MSDPSDLIVTILDMTNGDPLTAPVLGSLSVPASAVGPIAPILDRYSITATYIDLTPLGIAVMPGQSLAFCLRVQSPLPSHWAIQTAIFSDLYPGGQFFTIAGDGTLAFWGDAAFKTFVEPPLLPVTIDIKPGSFPNSIDPRSRGVLPVAILTTATFDAAAVEPATVRFGSTGRETPPLRSALEDVNGDGHLDLLLHFATQATGIECGNTSASLTGKTFGGQWIEGSDSMSTVGCR